MAWNYSEKEYKDSKVTIPAGDHRVRMASVTPKISKTSGNPMYEIKFDVSNFQFKIFYYLVFSADNSQRVNGSLGSIRDSFGVTPSVDPEQTPPGWTGAVGAARVKLDEEGKPKISFFIEKSKQDKLPAWVEIGAGGAPNLYGTPPAHYNAPELPADFQAVSDADMPGYKAPFQQSIPAEGFLAVDDDDTSLPFDL